MRRACVEFSGTPVSQYIKRNLKEKIKIFLEEDFAWFRERAEEAELGYPGHQSVACNFGDEEMCYILCASINDENGNVYFEIYDENYNNYLSFEATRVSGNLVKVIVMGENIKKVHQVLNLLNKPSWLD